MTTKTISVKGSHLPSKSKSEKKDIIIDIRLGECIDAIFVFEIDVHVGPGGAIELKYESSHIRG